MSNPTVSVIVVSRNRPEALELCLLGLSQLYYQPFEIIVVANEVSAKGIPPALRSTIKVIGFEPANISTARNTGLKESGGQIVAFIDDDAVPEPTWLNHLVQPFTDSKIVAAGGYVIGRNGISLQWGARLAFADGLSEELPVAGNEIVFFKGEPARAVKTEGTNMAFRKDVLCRLGGFDECFEYYLDETDVNMRIAEQGWSTAIVPLAVVHHSYAESDQRFQSRVPKTLHPIGRSLAVFCRKHGADVSAARLDHRRHQRRRLLEFMRRGDLMPGDIHRLLVSFDHGWETGSELALNEVTPVEAHGMFMAFEGDFVSDSMHSDFGRFWRGNSLKRKIAEKVAKGERGSLYLFTFTSFFHHVRFEKPGMWVQKGGQFGRSGRTEKLFRFFTGKARFEREVKRVKDVREIVGFKGRENSH